MEQKSIKVYLVLIILTAIVLFLLVRFDNDENGMVQYGAATALPTAAMDLPAGSKDGSPSGLPATTAGKEKPEVSPDSRSMVVYINWDGFAWYYYELANNGKTKGTPVLNRLVERGVLFTDAFTGVPSVTNPMQTSILTGAWPSVTGNCYWYLDKKSRKIVKTGREYKAENFAETVIRQGFRAVSIHQFMLENRGTSADSIENPYLQFGNNADYAKRFDGAIRYVKSLQKDNLPAFIAVYIDDLDGIGHNDWFTYGVPPALTEKERLARITKRLEQMDAKLGEFIQAFKDTGIDSCVSFLLASDHGMTPYGSAGLKSDGYARSKLPDIEKELQKLGFRTEVLREGRSMAANTEIALVTAGLQVQLYFAGSYDEMAAGRIKAALSGKEYVGAIMDKAQLQERGAAVEYADMLISPKPPYCFKNDNKRHRAGGQHDSLDETSQHVFALMWGKGIKQGIKVNERVYVIDFAETMASLLGIGSPKNSTGRLPDGILG